MLKPVFESVQSQYTSSFLVRVFHQEAFRAPFHYHPEYELTLITRGEGRRYVGDRMDNFSRGDLVLLGADLPHCWKTEASSGDSEKESAGAIVIQFQPDFLGNGFFSRPELSSIERLLQQSKGGVSFYGNTHISATKKIMALAKEEDSFKKMMGLLQLLQLLALSEEDQLLIPHRDNSLLDQEDQQRINNILAYIIDHFKEKISLDEIAQAAHMTPNAFCKYFKKVTRRTFMETVIDYRLNYATRLLVQTDKTVASICFDSGFGDISHFNKTFKSKMKVSPLQYRKQFLK